MITTASSSAAGKRWKNSALKTTSLPLKASLLAQVPVEATVEAIGLAEVVVEAVDVVAIAEAEAAVEDASSRYDKLKVQRTRRLLLLCPFFCKESQHAAAFNRKPEACDSATGCY